MRRRETREERLGWVKAPPVVEAEIRAVWQEDELPDEITQAPGFRPFTLGLDSQEWVDSMAEVVDGGNGVYGRPKPVLAPQHRALTTPAPPPPTPTPRTPAPSRFPPASYQPPPPSPPPKPRILMPDIDEASPPPAPRHTIPEIDHQPPTKSHPVMPDIDEASPAPTPRPVMPEIDAATRPSKPHAAMPDIEDSAPSRTRTLPKRVVIPEIGEEQQEAPNQHPPTMPEIG